MRSLRCAPLAFALGLLLAACLATINATPSPATARERLAALEITYQETNRTIQDLVAAGTLQGEPAARVATALEAAREAMRVVRVGVDGPDGLELLNAANEVLIALTARLREEGQ